MEIAIRDLIINLENIFSDTEDEELMIIIDSLEIELNK